MVNPQSHSGARAGRLPGRDFRWAGSGRAPYQVLVLPYRQVGQAIEYAVFQRADAGCWQFTAGGGEGGERPIEAAHREAREEAGLPAAANLFHLDSLSTVPVTELVGSLMWGPDVLVVPEFPFGADARNLELRISAEHTAFRWVDYETCRDMLHWQSNRNALLELHHRIVHGMTPGQA